MRSIYTESRIDSYRYYHLSKESDLTELVPRIPDNFMTKNKYEDSKTPRVVFAPSINQCLMGLSRNLANEEFYVYTPYLIDLNKLKKPHINQVPDCEITGEVWSTEKIRVKKVGKIKVIKDAGKDGYPYIFGNQQKAELYDWEYKVLIDESTQCFDEISKEDIKRNKLLKPVFIINTYTGSAFANLMKATLKFEYTHALISMDSSLSSMYSYDDNKIVNNKLYKGFIQDDLARYKKDHPDGKMRVTCILVTSEIFDNIMHSINYYKKREKNTAYSILNLFKWIAGSNKISSWGDLNMFCSEFVDTILKHNNIDITGKSAINTAPDDFGKYTGRNNIFVVFEGAIKDYNYKEVNKKIEDMKKSVEYDRLFAMTSTSMKSRNDITVNKKNHAGEILYNIIKREDAVPYGSNNLQTKKDTEFELPSLDSFKPDIQTLFDNADLKHIWLSSDWHFFKNHYKKEANYVNTREILTWCRKNLDKDDIFVYLGDISFRYANKEDQEQSQKFMASIPAGRKILVLGNHDRMLGDEYYNKCGFDYVVEEFTWNKYLFTHRPVNMDIYPSDWWNIHGHCHNIRRYNTTDGLKNVNVYPKFYNNKPVTLDYIIKHKEDLVKNNEWNFNAGYGETTYFIKGVRSGKTLLHEAMIRNNYPKPVVYFSQNINSETIAYMVSLFQDRIGSRVGIKLHFGESGNKNFLNPKLLKDLVKCTNAALIDSNTAYDGSTRGNTSEHIQTAHNNGFDFGFIDILDADGDITISVPKRYQIEHELNELHNGNKKGYESPVSPGRHLQEINVGSHIKNYDSLIVYTHFKGHSLAGYGGALKNIGMGIPSGKVGKKQIHGQGWEKGLIFLERLVESASAIESMFDGKIVYVNVLANISTACDCEKDAPKPIMPNIGVLVSDDIVAIEQASIDLIRNTRKNKDIMEQIAKLGGFHQIEYMKFLGMGRSDYRLKSLNNETIKLENYVHEKSDNLNYENPMGRKINTREYHKGTDKLEILSGDAIDVEIKNTIETFDIKKNRLLLESKDIVKDYNDFIECNFKKNLADGDGTPSYSVYFKYLRKGLFDLMYNTKVNEADIKRIITTEYHYTEDPDIIRKTVELRVKYIDGINAILKEMVKNNGSLLGLSSQQIEILINGLSKDETAGKSIEMIKRTISMNSSKYIKSNNTILDLRELGAGVYVGSEDDKDHQLLTSDKIKTVIQKCLTYDLILDAHGGSDYDVDIDRANKELNRIKTSLADEIMSKFPKTNNLANGLVEYKMDRNLICGRIIIYLYDNYVFDDEELKYNRDFKNIIRRLFYNIGEKSFTDYINSFPDSDREGLYKRMYLIFKKYLDSLKSFYKKYDLTSYRISQDGNYILSFDVVKGGSRKWSFNIRYLDGKTYKDVKQVIKMAKSNGFDKILIMSCNPKGLDLPKDLTRNVTFGTHSVYKENEIIEYDYNDEVLREEYSDIYSLLDNFENEYKLIAAEFNIDYYDDVLLNEAYDYIINESYNNEIISISEAAKTPEIFNKLIAFITKVISFIISLIKKFIKAIKYVLDKVHKLISSRKKNTVKKSKIQASFISVNGRIASLTNSKEIENQKELEKYYSNTIQTIVKAMQDNSNKQVELERSLKNKCEMLKRQVENNIKNESATSIKDINSNDIALENSTYINEEAGLGKKCSDVKSVSKNINLYRVTVDTNVKKSLANSDYTYFNMYDEDRDFYKGTWRHALNNTYKTSIPYMYEATFVLTKDLKLPNRKERLNIARTFLYNEDVLERIAAGCFSNTYIKRGYTDKEITDFATKYPDDYKVQINNRVNNYKSMPIEELFYWFCTSLAYKDRRNMELYVKELKKHGYNAVFDDHGVDGGNIKNIGIFPIIIFDPSKAVRFIEINKVTRYEEDLALERWQNWYNSQYSNISYHESSSLDIGGMFSIPINEAATSIKESRFTKFKDDYSKNTSKHLSDFIEIKVDNKFADEHKDIAKDIKNQGLDYNKDVAYVWMNKNDKWVAKLYIDNTDYGDGKKWIAMIEVSNGYRGCGLGKELVMHAINVDKCDALGVHKDNKVAIKLYESCGFKISDEAKERVNSGKDKYYWMYRNGAPKPGMYHSSNYDENMSYNEDKLDSFRYALEYLKYNQPVNESVTYNDVKKLVDTFSKEDLLKFTPRGNFVDSPNCVYRNIIKSGKYGGFIEVYKMVNSKSTGFITIAVQQEARNSGIGSRLVNTMIKDIDKNIISKLIWRCEKDNISSNALAKKCGFKLTSESKTQNTYTLELQNYINETNNQSVNEGYIKDEPDLYWKRKEFNEGKINLCFITGLSGSGKSTMGADMAGKPNVDHCDMDNVVFNCNFDDKELSELGEMINAFFKGPGRQYRLKKGDLQSVTNNHRTKISNALVDFAIKYAASHKNTKFIVEGVYLFWMVSPEKLKDCAVYIKGTSSIKSAIRAAKRDGGMQDNTKDKVIIFSKTLAKKFYGMTYNTGNIDRWRRYYQTLQDKEEKSMKEAYIFNKKDIYYNRNKFNNGETNLCFITGQSGSGKSTMGKHMQGRCEVYDLDDVIWNKESFTMDNFKEYGELIYTFFNGKGKKYYLTAAELKGEKPVQDGIPKPKNNWDYEHDLINDFVNYAISWAKSHKDIKYVLEGIWIYMYIEPSKLKDYAVYIKGTSMLTSIYRASKRDNRFKSNILHPGMWIDGEKGLKKYRDYFEPRSEESIHEVKRSDLPDSAFGIPEDRKFPLDTEQHVKSAIHLFGHAEESKKKSLAKRISSAAKKYDIRIPETTQVYKYLNESVNEIIPDGIENIIFDMGKVLVDANTLDALYDNANIPDEYCEEIRDFINEKLFYDSDIESKRKIQGYDLEQIRDYLTKALPEHISPYMDDILDTLKPAMFIYSYVPEMLDLLRSMGYKLYYLSNWDRYSYDLEEEFFAPLLKQFDGGLFSFELGEVLKPDREMYEALCEKYHIFANKSIFFDDMEENIEAARSVGMAAYKFDKDITPKILFGTCVRIPDNSDDLILIANGDDGFTKRHISEFGWWYLDERRTASGIDEECYYKTLDDAIKYKVDRLISQDAFTDDSPNVLEYVYTNAKAFCEDKTPPELVCVGQILLYESGGYEWVVQYPLKMENRILCGLKEFSMASINPVIGINKPFLIKVGDQNHPELLPTDHFVYSQDIESDKVLTVDDDNHLKVKKVKDLDIIEAYEFVGDMAYIHRLNKLYKENAEVSNLYTLLTNKPMLTEDQIDFDPSFKRIDFDLLKQKELAEMATLRDNLMEAMNYNPLRLPVLESTIIKKPSFLSKYNTAGDICIKEDFDGVYFYSDITKKRSASAASTLQLTENMLRAIL